MFGRFLKFNPLRFSSAPSENAYKLLIFYKYRLHNLGLVETHGIDYTTF